MVMGAKKSTAGRRHNVLDIPVDDTVYQHCLGSNNDCLEFRPDFSSIFKWLQRVSRKVKIETSKTT